MPKIFLSLLLAVFTLISGASADTVTNSCLSLSYESSSDGVQLNWEDPWGSDPYHYGYNHYCGYNHRHHGYTTRYKVKRAKKYRRFRTISARHRHRTDFFDSNVRENKCYSYYVEKFYHSNHRWGHHHWWGGVRKCRSKVVHVCIDSGGNENIAPIANAGLDQSVSIGDTVVLDGSSSADPEGSSISYAWQIISSPAGSTAQLDDPSAESPSFLADRAGEFVLQLIVDDGELSSEIDQIIINTSNLPPLADAGADISAFVGEAVQLDGTGSRDPEDAFLIYTRNQSPKPVPKPVLRPITKPAFQKTFL